MRCEDERVAQIETYLAGDLDAAASAELRVHLRGCPACRRAYDRGAEAISLFEGQVGPVPAAALADVRRAVLAEVGAPPAWGGWRWLAAAAVLVGGAGLAVWATRAPRPEPEGFAVRGGDDAAGWGVRVFCIDDDAQPPRVRASAAQGGALVCGTGDHLDFTYSTDRAGHLALVSVGPDRVRWYSDSAHGFQVGGARDRALGGSVDLGGHAPGVYRLMARLGDAPMARAEAVARLRSGAEAGFVQVATITVTGDR